MTTSIDRYHTELFDRTGRSVYVGPSEGISPDTAARAAARAKRIDFLPRTHHVTAQDLWDVHTWTYRDGTVAVIVFEQVL